VKEVFVMGEGLGEAMKLLMVFSIIGIISILGGISYGLYKLILWIF
jgi:hypothetical protein